MRVALHVVLLAACAGCGTPAILDRLPPDSFTPSTEFNIFGEGQYITFDHRFTDADAETVARSAERQCATRKRVAVKTSSACSLTRCTTHYRCVSREDAAAAKGAENTK